MHKRNCFGISAQTAVVFGTVVAALPIFSSILRVGHKPKDTLSTILQLEREVPQSMTEGRVPGLSIALIRGGKTIWMHGFGIKEAGTSQPVTSETVFEAASLSKPVFAYGVLKLVEQGKLGLDVPLTTYL